MLLKPWMLCSLTDMLFKGFKCTKLHVFYSVRTWHHEINSKYTKSITKMFNAVTASYWLTTAVIRLLQPAKYRKELLEYMQWIEITTKFNRYSETNIYQWDTYNLAKHNKQFYCILVPIKFPPLCTLDKMINLTLKDYWVNTCGWV